METTVLPLNYYPILCCVLLVGVEPTRLTTLTFEISVAAITPQEHTRAGLVLVRFGFSIVLAHVALHQQSSKELDRCQLVPPGRVELP